jgi:hypothetical protein
VREERRKFHKEVLHNFYSSPYLLGVVKLNNMLGEVR